MKLWYNSQTCRARRPSEAVGTSTPEASPLVDAKSAITARLIGARCAANSTRVTWQVLWRHRTADEQVATAQCDVTQAADEPGCSDVTGMRQESGHVADATDRHEPPSRLQQSTTLYDRWPCARCITNNQATVKTWYLAVIGRTKIYCKR